MTHRWRTCLDLAAIGLVLVLLVLAVDPRGDFALNDDWDFAKAAWAFAETGEFQFTGYTAASVRVQAVWGALWTRLFTRSYEVLRASTLVLALATLWLLYGILSRLGVARATRLLAVGAMLAHPIWFWCAFTFMTHVPAIFLSLVALSAWLEAIRRDDARASALGAIATVGSYFIRQTAVVNSVAALALFLLYRERISKRWRLHAAIAAAPLILFAAVFFGTDLLGGSGGEFHRHYKFIFEDTLSVAGYAAIFINYTLFSWIDGGLFFLPFSALAAAALVRGSSWMRTLFAVTAAVFLTRAIYLIAVGLPMPFYSRSLRSDVFAANVFVNIGLGPRTLADVWKLGAVYPFGIASGWRVVLTLAAALAGAAALAWCLAEFRRSLAGNGAELYVPRFLLIHLLAANGALGLSYFYLDRYGLDAHWPLVILFAVTLPIAGPRRWVAAALVGLLLLFSAASMAEYFSWNRARWAAIGWLEARGARHDQMDAGVEHRMHTIAEVGKPRPRALPPRPRYRVTFNPLPKHRVIHAVPYERPLGLRDGTIFVLERQSGH